MSDVIKFNKDLIEKSSFSKIQDFHNLMRYRIRDILLVSSLYDLIYSRKTTGYTNISATNMKA
ncbi:hypothetical protein MROS_2025 [Melioribacter roseus P3M-2]|uniref:Uncharacterized protein n=1 Tax=Melioribacter roseus (strain DSM 23840 / JCM 17771 / VKM B-2668 / P3M-2) TaxID=1191523 RepID=I6YXE6_MELRP|nr:hypothetical protein [Melioribacter roseus]AFN75257.1 hypothetical protein MROS_2025 [Melioribacter roseus P3M-2]